MTNTTALDLDRAEFEAEILKLNPDISLERWPAGHYKLHAVDGHWRGWQLLRAALAAKGQQEPVARMERFPEDQPASRAMSPLRPAWLGSVPPEGTLLYAAPVAQQSEAAKYNEEEDEDRFERWKLTLDPDDDIRTGYEAGDGEARTGWCAAIESYGIKTWASIPKQSKEAPPIYQVAKKHSYAWSDVGRETFDGFGCSADYKCRIVYAASQPTEAGADEYDDCPKCKGSRVLGEVRGIRCSTCDGTGMVHRADGEYMGECPCGGEAGAPTAVADVQGAFDYWMHSRLFANPPQSVTPYDAFLAGRESAAPAAPVREGDREQDANLRHAVYSALGDFTIEDGTVAMHNAAVDAVMAAINAFTHKGAQ